MAYMNQDKKKAIAPKVKEICKRHGVKRDSERLQRVDSVSQY
jgi:hypothetical protein